MKSSDKYRDERSMESHALKQPFGMLVASTLGAVWQIWSLKQSILLLFFIQGDIGKQYTSNGGRIMKVGKDLHDCLVQHQPIAAMWQLFLWKLLIDCCGYETGWQQDSWPKISIKVSVAQRGSTRSSQSNQGNSTCVTYSFSRKKGLIGDYRFLRWKIQMKSLVTCVAPTRKL